MMILLLVSITSIMVVKRGIFVLLLLMMMVLVISVTECSLSFCRATPCCRSRRRITHSSHHRQNINIYTYH